MKRIYHVIMDEEEFPVEIENSEEFFELTLGERRHRFKLLFESESLFSFLIDDSEVLEADSDFQQDRCDLYVRNVPYRLTVFDPKRRIASQNEMASGGGKITAPMPGKIIEVKVKPGQEVNKDDPLIVIEAMKMQNELNAPLSGVVKEVAVANGDAVEADQKLVVVAKS